MKSIGNKNLFREIRFSLAVFFLSAFGPSLQAAAINYTTTSYCPTATSFTVSEQTTAYNQQTSSAVSLGACGVNMNMFDQSHYAAIEPGDWQNGAGCGACAALNYSSHATTVMIVDECASCGTGTHHLDLSAVAYGELVGSTGCAVNGSGGSVNTGGCPTAPGANQVTWTFVQCPLTGSANIKFNNASGDITYAFKDGSGANSNFYPVIFWDTLFPIQSVQVSVNSGGSWTAIARDTGDGIPNYWGHNSGEPNSPAGNTLEYAIKDDRGNSVTIGPIGVSPILVANNASFVAYGQSTVQLPGCVVGPTNTPTKTNTFTNTPTVSSPTATPTHTLTPTLTFTVTPTKTFTPLAGCKYTYYDGETTATNLSAGSTFGTNTTISEVTTMPHGGTNDMQLAFNWPAGSYFAGMGWNWTHYSNNSLVLNLNNYTTLEFWIRATTGAPVTNMTVTLADYGGGGSGGVTASTPVTLSTYLPAGVTSTWQVVDIPTSAFNTGGASWDKTKVGEIDFATGIGQSSGTQTVFIDDFGFYGTCPTNTPTNTNTPVPPTNTFTPTFTRTFTVTNTFTATNTPTKTLTLTNTNSPVPPTSTFTPTATKTNTLTSTNTPVPPTSTSTNTPTQTFTSTNTNTALPPTNTFTSTATKTSTFTGTNTAVPPTNTFTLTRTNTPTNTNTANPPTATFTFTRTDTPANTFTPTNTPTGPIPPTNTFTNTSTRTNTPTSTNTANPPTNTFTFTRTNTPTNSFTATNTPTGPIPPTNTFTNTSTRSNTPTFTNTANPPTNTFTFTSTNTPTNSLTPTNTLTLTSTNTGTIPPTNTPTNTATPVMVAVSNGPVPPAASTQVPGASNVPVLQFSLNNPGISPLNMTSLTLAASGTGNDATGITSVNLYWDANGNGIVDAGDTLLGTATYGSDNGTAVINFTSGIPAGGSRTFLVTYTFSPTATNGTYFATIGNSSDLTGTNTAGGAQFSGLPLTGAVVDVANATATFTPTFTSTSTKTNTPTASFTGTSTATFTGTSTSTASFTFTFTPTVTASFTPTSTSTPVFTNTHTATATPTRGVVSNPYPNPSQGGPVHVDVQLNGFSKVKFGVFTAAFRKIYEDTSYASANMTVTWDLKDKTGALAASGLYYLRVEVDEASGTTVKIKKVLVIR